MDYNNLKQFATRRQIEMLDAVELHKSQRKAADALGISRGTLSNAIRALRGDAARRGFAPEHDMTHVVPEGFILKGTSTYYNKDGKVSGQWVKNQIDQDKQREMLAAACKAFCETIEREPPTQVSKEVQYNDKLLNCYVITDYHLGALSWAEETGANWDLELAEDLIVKWFAQAIAQSPPAETAVFAQLSDFLHADGIEALTPASKHLLDVASRFAKVVRCAIRVLRRVVKMLLAKHPKLHIVMADANHDPVAELWMREWFAVLYEDEPRVTVDKSPSPYNVYEFGKTALFFHHGHKRKVTNVAEVFVAQFREIFGRTRYAYAHMGHLHHLDVKENNLMIVEQHRTLTAPDAYSARGGYISGRDAKVITYHRDYGEVSRLTINSDLVQ